MVSLVCTKQDLIPMDHTSIRWLKPDTDHELAKEYWGEREQDLSYEPWVQAHKLGTQYAALVQDDKIVSRAGVWRYSDEAWKVAAVSTLDGFCHKGHTKRIGAFVAAYILASGRLATCSTDDGNIAMIATAKRVGFQKIPEERVWWVYPLSPDL